MSKHFSPRQLKGLDRLGDTMLPGDGEFESFSAARCSREVDRILDFMPAGWENEDGDDAARKSKAEADLDGEDLPELDEKEEEALKGDQSLTWDEEEKDKEDDPAAVNLPDGEDDDEDEEEEGDDDDEEDEENEDGGKSAKAAKPRPRRR